MSTWTRGEKVTKTVEYTVPTHEPWGAAWSEVQNALGAALEEFRTIYAHPATDDAIRFSVRDDEIVISFEVLP